MKRIPGNLDAAGLALLAGHVDDDEYRRRADAFKPDEAGLKAEALRLWHSGYTARDISVALRLAEDVVQNWIAGASS